MRKRWREGEGEGDREGENMHHEGVFMHIFLPLP